MPGIYLHSLIGTKNDLDAVLLSNSKRDINRKVIDSAAINDALKDPISKVSRINRELGRLISIRTKQPAFHPNGNQKVLMLSPEVFSVLRTSPDCQQNLLCLTNITEHVVKLDISLSEVGVKTFDWKDLVSDMEWMAEDNILHVTLQPYDVIWLEAITT